MKANAAAIAYLVPTKLAVIVSSTFGAKPPPIIAVMMDMETREIELLDVQL